MKRLTRNISERHLYQKEIPSQTTTLAVVSVRTGNNTPRMKIVVLNDTSNTLYEILKNVHPAPIT